MDKEEIYRLTPKGLMSNFGNEAYLRLKQYMQNNNIKGIALSGNDLIWLDIDPRIIPVRDSKL